MLLHVVTEKGHGFKPAAEDPVFFHTPAPLCTRDNGSVVAIKKSSLARPTPTWPATRSIEQMQRNPRVTVMTAAMCQGNKLEQVRDEFPERFFDTGICESHAVAFAAGQAKAGLRPIVDIYSTFLQRSYDQIFQEVALQNLPVTFMLDRAGLTGPDGPTHHGDVRHRLPAGVPEHGRDGPRRRARCRRRCSTSPCSHDGPARSAIPRRMPKRIGRRTRLADRTGPGRNDPLGPRRHVPRLRHAAGECLRPPTMLAAEGLDVGVINARFVKPLDREIVDGGLRDAASWSPWKKAA